MIFPIGTDRPLRTQTVVTYALITVNVIVFGVFSFLQTTNPDAYSRAMAFGCVDGQDFRWYTLVTSAFMHLGIMHLVGNMLVLWAFGPNLEDRFGKVGFLVFYLLGGAASGGLHAAFSDNPAAGASGAIAAVTGAFLVLFPFVMVRALSLLNMGFIVLPAWWFIAFAIIWDVFMQGTGLGRQIAHLAHIGGYLFGVSVALALLGFRIIGREDYDLLSFAKHRHRRSQMRAAISGQQRAMQERFAKAKAEVGESDRIAAARAEVVRLLADTSIGPAAAAYRSLADAFGHVPGATILQRRYQYDLASRAYQAQDIEIAAYAFGKFLEAYPRDPESAQIRLLLGLIHARSLNDPIKAKSLINEAMKELDEDAKVIARQELEALG